MNSLSFSRAGLRCRDFWSASRSAMAAAIERDPFLVGDSLLELVRNLRIGPQPRRDNPAPRRNSRDRVEPPGIARSPRPRATLRTKQARIAIAPAQCQPPRASKDRFDPLIACIPEGSTRVRHGGIGSVTNRFATEHRVSHERKARDAQWFRYGLLTSATGRAERVPGPLVDANIPYLFQVIDFRAARQAIGAVPPNGRPLRSRARTWKSLRPT